MTATLVADSSFFLSDGPCSPFGLCLNENGTKYLCTVTSQYSQYIITFDLNIQNPVLFTTKPEGIDGYLSGICLTADKQNYLVGIYGGSKIIKLNLNGNYVDTFMDSTEKLPDGSSALVSICGICLNAEGTHYLFVNDGLPNVCKVDLEGKNPTVFIYECIHSVIPNGICLSFDRSSYYIAMWSSSSIIKLDLDGTNITTFIDDNLLLPDGTKALIGPEAILQISPTNFLIANYNAFNIILYTSQIVCFGDDTKILTAGGYRAIRELKKGDLVKTLKHEFLPIYMISYKNIYISDISHERTKDKLYVCAEEKYPEVFEDLIITGSHSILVDEFKGYQRSKTEEILGDIYVTDGKYRLPACVDERSTLSKLRGMFKIWHLALDNEDYYSNYGIWANGLLVETCSKRYLKEISDMIPV